MTVPSLLTQRWFGSEALQGAITMSVPCPPDRGELGPFALMRQPFAELDSIMWEAGFQDHLALGSVHAPAAAATSPASVR